MVKPEASEGDRSQIDLLCIKHGDRAISEYHQRYNATQWLELCYLEDSMSDGPNERRSVEHCVRSRGGTVSSRS